MGTWDAITGSVRLTNTKTSSYTSLLEAQYAIEVPPTERAFYRSTLLTTSLSPTQDLSGLPPRKRIHPMISGFDVMGNSALQTQNMSL